MKKVIAACIDRILEFDTQEEAAKYLEALRGREGKFRILYREEVGGKYRIRIQEQYNKNPMIEELTKGKDAVKQ